MGLLSPQISTKTMVPLCRQLATSYEAGIPILKGLELVGGQMKDAQTREVLLNMQENIRNGATLGDSARLHSKRLPAFFIELLASGEAGGRLDVMLRDLAQYYEDRLEMMRRVIGSLVYPSLQLTMAWFLGSFSLGLVGKLDLTSTEPFNLEAYLIEYGWFQAKAMGVVAVVAILCAVLSYFGLFRYVWGWCANFLWPVNKVSRKFALARFFRSLSLLVGSGMNIKSCIENSAAITINPYVEKDLLRAVPLVADGATLVQAFGACRYLTPVSREMITIGEQSGNLETSLRKVSEYHLEEATYAVHVMTKVLNVLIMLAVGGVVGYVVISFYGSLYGNMLDSI